MSSTASRVQERLLNDEVDLAVMGLIEDAHDLEVAISSPTSWW